jgi:hypothetical protein
MILETKSHPSLISCSPFVSLQASVSPLNFLRLESILILAHAFPVFAQEYVIFQIAVPLLHGVVTKVKAAVLCALTTEGERLAVFHIARNTLIHSNEIRSIRTFVVT